MSCAFLLFSTKIVFYQIFLRLILFSFTWSTSSKKIRCLIEKHWKSKLFLYYYHTAFLQGDVYETDGPQQAGSILQTTVRSQGRTVSCSAVEAVGSRRGSAISGRPTTAKLQLLPGVKTGGKSTPDSIFNLRTFEGERAQWSQARALGIADSLWWLLVSAWHSLIRMGADSRYKMDPAEELFCVGSLLFLFSS